MHPKRPRVNLLENFRRNHLGFLLRGNKYRGTFHAGAGLVALHPIAEALEDEYFYVAWLLRHEAFLRFGCDPDAVFSEKADKRGFVK